MSKYRIAMRPLAPDECPADVYVDADEMAAEDRAIHFYAFSERRHEGKKRVGAFSLDAIRYAVLVGDK